jgi:hypothetical protein
LAPSREHQPCAPVGVGRGALSSGSNEETIQHSHRLSNRDVDGPGIAQLRLEPCGEGSKQQQDDGENAGGHARKNNRCAGISRARICGG